ncbi:hypothetical protein DIPPA_03607 [Diplonema papillatum]|nr:hypothetical protein DIPPA_03607 [Diplonema papillatum]
MFAILKGGADGVLAGGEGGGSVVAELLSAGAGVNLADKGGSTALIVASRKGDERVVGQLLAAGAASCSRRAPTRKLRPTTVSPHAASRARTVTKAS